MKDNDQETTGWKMSGEFPNPPYWELTGRPGAWRVLTAVFAHFTAGHSLIIEQSWPTPEIDALLRSLAEAVTPSDTTWNAVRYAIPLGQAMPKALSDLIQHHAGPEYCANAFVTRATDAVLLWFDFPDEPVVLHPGIPEAMVKRFSEEAGLVFGLRK